MFLCKDIFDVVSKQVEVYTDLHLWPYFGDEDDTDCLSDSEAERGTTVSTSTLATPHELM